MEDPSLDLNSTSQPVSYLSKSANRSRRLACSSGSALTGPRGTKMLASVALNVSNCAERPSVRRCHRFRHRA